MIAQQSLETKTKALKERLGNLAIEKLSAIERIDAIGEETRQIALLLTVFGPMSEELAQDAAAEKSMGEQMDSMAARILSLEKSVGFDGDFKAACDEHNA